MLFHDVVRGGGAIIFSISTKLLLPMPKNKRGFNKYRAIAISRLLEKQFYSIVLSEQSSCVKPDNLQFEYIEHFSIVICTALLIEIIAYYNENGSDSYL